MVDDTRLELADAAAGRRHPQHIRLSRAQAQTVTSSSPVLNLEWKKRPHSLYCGVRGGRYKTRTCDLPHVKRMRYQLR